MPELEKNHPDFTYSQGLLQFEDCPYNGFVKDHYDNGAKKSITQFHEGKAHGVFKSWYENGKLQSATLFKAGRQHGQFKEWWPNSQVKMSANYFEGLLHGLSEEYYENGSKKESASLLWVKSGANSSISMNVEWFFPTTTSITPTDSHYKHFRFRLKPPIGICLKIPFKLSGSKVLYHSFTPTFLLFASSTVYNIQCILMLEV